MRKFISAGFWHIEDWKEFWYNKNNFWVFDAKVEIVQVLEKNMQEFIYPMRYYVINELETL